MVLIGQRIKKHRLQKRLTQEEFAEIMLVSGQAVSRWENDVTFPDLNTLARMALYFDISTDELLGMDLLIDYQAICNLHTNVHQLIRSESYLEAIDTLRLAIKKYPNNDGFKSELVLAISVFDGSKLEDFNEAIRLSNDLLNNASDDKIKSTIKANLSCLYKNIGDLDHAESTILTLGHVWESREVLKALLLGDKKSAIELILELAFTLTKDDVDISKMLMLGISERSEDDKLEKINEFLKRYS